MNRKYLYWGTTGLVALLALASGVLYFVADAPAETFARLGFPDYFRIQLGAAKIVGGVALLVPLPRWLKEWTYAGFTIDFASAAIAHLAMGDPLSSAVTPGVALILLWTSYASYHWHVLAPTANDSSSVDTR
ncbi:MAG: DoxX family protein [Salinibacter sp.]